MQNTVIGTFNRAPIGIRLDKSDQWPLWIIRVWSRWGIGGVYFSPSDPASWQNFRHGVRITWSWWNERLAR